MDKSKKENELIDDENARAKTQQLAIAKLDTFN